MKLLIILMQTKKRSSLWRRTNDIDYIGGRRFDNVYFTSTQNCCVCSLPIEKDKLRLGNMIREFNLIVVDTRYVSLPLKMVHWDVAGRGAVGGM